LVEQDDAGEAVAGPQQPLLVARELLIERQEAGADLGVERGILLEPALVRLAALGALPEPEAQDLVGMTLRC
jgi:hypothetical protein